MLIMTQWYLVIVRIAPNKWLSLVLKRAVAAQRVWSLNVRMMVISGVVILKICSMARPVHADAWNCKWFLLSLDTNILTGFFRNFTHISMCEKCVFFGGGTAHAYKRGTPLSLFPVIIMGRFSRPARSKQCGRLTRPFVSGRNWKTAFLPNVYNWAPTFLRFIDTAKKPQVFKPGDEWSNGAKQ
jgi:hypothetical protein